MSRSGVIESFGDDGLGVAIDAQGIRYDFHSTAIADGSRSIEPGNQVTFDVVPGRRGLYEAANIVRAGTATT